MKDKDSLNCDLVCHLLIDAALLDYWNVGEKESGTCKDAVSTLGKTKLVVHNN
jgi:hypothetical protein